jgi:ABC-type branched-subunit amino acid transport system substrate-binding protein
MKNTMIRFFCILLLAIVYVPLTGQDTVQRERQILNRNIQFYKTGMYEKAEQNFSLMVSRLPESPFITTNYLMLAKSRYKNKNYLAAINTGKEFIGSFPQSDYVDDIFYVMANCYYRLNRPTTAILNWEKAINRSHDEQLIDRIGTLITRTVRYILPEDEINSLDRQLNSPDGKVLAGIGLAEKYIDRGDAYLATETLQKIINKHPESRFTPQAKSLLKIGSTNAQGHMGIALLLPLTGFNSQVGMELKEGAEFALNEFNQSGPFEVELVIRDYGTEITRAITYYKELAANRNILAVFGPVENNIAAACVALSDYEKLTLISPTATDGELLDLSDHFFQLNSTITKRAEYLANYALDSLKIKRFATFSPIDNLFVRMVDRFEEIVTRDSAEVIAQEWYYPGDQDVNKQFMSIKRKGLKLTFADSLFIENPGLDSSHVDSMYREYQETQIELLNETSTKVDSADLAVTSIGGMFIPVYMEDIKFIAPQIAYSNIQAQLLGNGDWYDPDELKKNKSYINGLIFVSSGYMDEESWDFRQFRNKYRTTLKKSPTVYNMIGYDSMKYMLSPLAGSESAPSRETYLINLQKIKNYNGIYKSLIMDENNCNIKLQLIKYDYGQLIPIN